MLKHLLKAIGLTCNIFVVMIPTDKTMPISLCVTFVTTDNTITNNIATYTVSYIHIYVTNASDASYIANLLQQ